MEYTHHYDSPIGGITLASNGESLIGLWFDGQRYFADTLKGSHEICEDQNLQVFKMADEWLDIYFSGKAPDFIPPLSMKATNFQQDVWEILLTIPFGQTMSYGQIADRIGELRRLRRKADQMEELERAGKYFFQQGKHQDLREDSAKVQRAVVLDEAAAQAQRAEDQDEAAAQTQRAEGQGEDLAKKFFGRSSARAVGAAVGHNPISLIIPCHRVIGADRSLTGYAGGLDKKIWLLKHEGIRVR